MSRPPETCSTCDRRGAICDWCRRYCNRPLSGPCGCECHANTVYSPGRRSNFDKNTRFVHRITRESVEFGPELSYGQAQHAALQHFGESQ